MRDPMDRSQRLTDGTRWRTFMRLLRLDDLMTSYTNAGSPELASSCWISTSARPQDSSHPRRYKRRASQHAQEGNQVLLLLRRKADRKPFVIKIQYVTERVGRAVVKVG